MAQFDNLFTVFLLDTTTAPGTPLTSAPVTTIVQELDPPYTVVVNNQPATNIGGGTYGYMYAGFDPTKDYIVTFIPNTPLAITVSYPVLASGSKKFTATWYNNSVYPNVPLTGLSATCTGRQLGSPYTVVVNNLSMTDIGNGNYIYTYAGYDTNKDYIVTCNPNSSLAYIISYPVTWVVKDIATAVWQNSTRTVTGGNTSGGGSGIGLIGHSGLDAIDKKYLKETHEKVIKIEEKIPEIIQTIENIDNSELMTAIQEAEVEICSDIVLSKKEIKEDNILTRDLVRKKTKNLAELAQKQIDKEKEEAEKEEQSKKEEKEAEDLKNEFEKQEVEMLAKEFLKQESKL